MTREEILQNIRDSPNYQFLLSLPTSFGKSKAALEIIKTKVPESKILIVIPRLVLIENWKEEFKKWGMEHYLPYITFSTYVSLHKYMNSRWGCIICDEAHHLSSNCRDAWKKCSVYTIFLSATIKPELKLWMKGIYPDIKVIEVGVREAIEKNVLPDPKVILIPLQLDTTTSSKVISKPKAGKKQWITCNYRDRWRYLKDYSCKIKCTPWQYYVEKSNEIEYWKKRAMESPFFKNKWLHLCGERLKWLSYQKHTLVLELLKQLRNYRTLTFCSSIEQTEILGKYCINSKNKASLNNLKMFNEGTIKHITSVNMLNEGMNLVNCRIGIYAVLNSSEILVKQKTGRILRHKEPIIIIPYYVNTREEELVKQMMENYNSELVTTVNNITEIII